jgi:RimJ/RimL family protein N-acetyltransferase
MRWQGRPVGVVCVAGQIGLMGMEVGDRVSKADMAEVRYWTAAGARSRGVASAALQAVTMWAFDSFSADGLQQLKLVHAVGNYASCRVADKSGYAFQEISPAQPPRWFEAAHIHTRRADQPSRLAMPMLRT